VDTALGIYPDRIFWKYFTQIKSDISKSIMVSKRQSV
jgi:hypothetical protein